MGKKQVQKILMLALVLNFAFVAVFVAPKMRTAHAVWPVVIGAVASAAFDKAIDAALTRTGYKPKLVLAVDNTVDKVATTNSFQKFRKAVISRLDRSTITNIQDAISNAQKNKNKAGWGRFALGTVAVSGILGAAEAVFNDASNGNPISWNEYVEPPTQSSDFKLEQYYYYMATASQSFGGFTITSTDPTSTNGSFYLNDPEAFFAPDGSPHNPHSIHTWGTMDGMPPASSVDFVYIDVINKGVGFNISPWWIEISGNCEPDHQYYSNYDNLNHYFSTDSGAMEYINAYLADMKPVTTEDQVLENLAFEPYPEMHEGTQAWLDNYVPSGDPEEDSLWVNAPVDDSALAQPLPEADYLEQLANDPESTKPVVGYYPSDDYAPIESTDPTGNPDSNWNEDNFMDDPPSPPDSAWDVVGWLKYIMDWILYLVSGLIYFLKVIGDAIRDLYNNFRGFIYVLKDFFSFLPEQVVTILMMAIILGTVAGIIRGKS